VFEVQLSILGPGVVTVTSSVTPVFKAKSNAHSMCAQELSLHIYHIENDTE
jgi:hypothetical protein